MHGKFPLLTMDRTYMKRIIAVAVALAFSTASFAQAPKAAEPAKAVPATSAKGEPAKDE